MKVRFIEETRAQLNRTNVRSASITRKIMVGGIALTTLITSSTPTFAAISSTRGSHVGSNTSSIVVAQNTAETENTPDAQIAVTDSLTSVAEQKPAEFKSTVEALTPYVAENADGSISINAPAEVTNTLDKESYAAIRDSVNKANQALQSDNPQLRGLPKIPWSQIFNAVKRAGKWVWYKTHLCVAAVIHEWPNIMAQSPNPSDWVKSAALTCGNAMRK